MSHDITTGDQATDDDPAQSRTRPARPGDVEDLYSASAAAARRAAKMTFQTLPKGLFGMHYADLANASRLTALEAMKVVPPDALKGIQAAAAAAALPRGTFDFIKLPPFDVGFLRETASFTVPHGLLGAMKFPVLTEDFLGDAVGITRTLEAMRRNSFPDLAKASWVPEILGSLDTSAWTRALQASLTGPAIADLARAAAATGRLWAERWPGNLVGLDFHEAQVEELAEDGIPLWRVPGPAVARALLAAETTGERRVVLAEHGPQILDDCRTELTLLSDDLAADTVDPLLEAATLLDEGRPMAAVALVAAVLQSAFERALPDRDARLRLTGHRLPLEHFEVLDLHAAMVLRPLWVAMRPQNTPERRDALDAFSRHGSAHVYTVDAASYVNGVQGMMVATALLAYLNHHRSLPEVTSGKVAN